MAPWLPLCLVAFMSVGQSYAANSEGEVAAVMLALAESSAIPDLAHAVRAAQAAGVSGSELSAAETAAKSRAMADLKLLAEVATVAGSALVGAPNDFKTAVASFGINVNRIMAAFDNAALLGVPQQEIDQAWQVLRSELSSKLSAAVSAVIATPGKDQIIALSDAIFASHKLGVPADEVIAAREAYKQKMESWSTSGSLDFLEAAVNHAGIAHVPVSPKFSQWQQAFTGLKKVLAMPISEQSTPQSLMQAARAALTAGLPSNPVLPVVQQRAKDLAVANLLNILEHECSSGFPEHIGNLLEALSLTTEAGVPQSSLSTVSSQLQILGDQALQHVMIGQRTDVSQLAQGLELARLAGASNFTASKAALETEVRARLASAVAAAQAGAATAEKLEELALAISFVQKLAFSESELANARAVYEASLALALSSGDAAASDKGTKFANLARIPVSEVASTFSAVLDEVRACLTLPMSGHDKLDRLQQASKRATEVGLSASHPDVITLRDMAKTCAVNHVNMLISSGETMPGHVAQCEAALQIAEEAGVTGATLDELRLNVRSLAKETLDNAMSEGLDNMAEIKLALRLAVRTGVANISSLTSDLSTQVAARLAAARSATESSATATSMEELAKALHCAHKWGEAMDTVEVARQVFAAKLDGPSFGANDMPFLEHIVPLSASYARVIVPDMLQQWVAAQAGLRKALAISSSSEALEECLRAIATADGAALPQTSERVSVETRARSLASVYLGEMSTGSVATIMVETVQAAMVAGISGDALNQGLAVVNALGTSTGSSGLL